MHKYGFFHRDMKPENLLLTGKKIKIADFGLAREIRSIPPYTEYVSTRYYRAPECILRSTNYNSPIDIWALGCILAEMYMHPMPLFYGSTEKEVFYKICSILGSPNNNIWPEGINQANLIGMKIPQNHGTNLKNIVIGASDEAIDLMEKMLKWDPNSRETASNLLNHPFFNGCKYENKLINSTNFFSDFGDVKNFNKTNRRFRPNNDEKNDKDNNKNKDKDDDNFNKLLNDTEGFNKLLNQLKKEESENNKNYEKNKNKNLLEESFYKRHLNINSNEINNKNNNEKKIISEVNENDSDSDDNNINSKKENKKKEDVDELDFLLNSNNNIRNKDIEDNFNRDSNKGQSSKYDFIFNDNSNKKKDDDLFDEYFKKNNERDSSNIDSEIKKILDKDTGLESNNKLNSFYKENKKSNNKVLQMSRARSQINTKLLNPQNNQYEEQSYNLNSIVNTNRRGGGRGSVKYEPNKNSLFNDNDNKSFNINLNNQDKYFFNKELNPYEYKDKKSQYEFNNMDNFGELINRQNSYCVNDKKFNLYDNNDSLFSPFRNKKEK